MSDNGTGSLFKHKADEVSARASRRWLDILTGLAGIPHDSLDRRHHACPKCGGTDRFRLLDQDAGAVFCNKCFSSDNGDGIAAVAWMLSINRGEAIDRVGDFLGLAPQNGEAKAGDPLEAVCRAKRMPKASAVAYGARVDGRAVVFPMFGPDGDQCSEFTIWPSGSEKSRKGLCAKGKPAGIFLPVTEGKPRVPQPGETWLVVEGCKDACALAGLGYLAMGLPTCHMAQKFAKLLRGCDVTLVPDRDVPSIEGFEKSARRVYGVASDASMAALPAEVTETDGKDVRDILAQPDGERLVREAIEQATPFQVVAGESKRKARGPVVVSEPSSTDLRSPSGRTDRANAIRFAAFHGKDVRWCDPWGKWLVWDGKRWATDAQRRIEGMGKEVADLIWREVAGLLPVLDPHTVAEVTRFARSTSNTRGISDMLASVRSEPGIAILPSVLDAHPWLLNCANGTVDLKTGDKLPHNREHFLTKVCPHDYLLGAEAECPIWELSIDKIFGGKADLIGFFRRWCGSAIVGTVIEHILVILWGSGSNGKSLIVETLLEALGEDYACKGASDLLLASQGDRHPTEKADLFGKRLVIVNETEDGRRLAEGVVKELTGGDKVKARRMREDFWEFPPSHSLGLVSNHKPGVRGTDHGIWRRLRLLPFTQRFWDRGKGETGPADYEANPHLKDELRPELAGIVAWLVKACREWQRDGLGQPDEVTAATADYREVMDTLATFLVDCCVLQEGTTAKASEVRKKYDDWCKENGEHPVSGRKLGEYLTDRNVVRRKSNGIWYSGMALR